MAPAILQAIWSMSLKQELTSHDSDNHNDGSDRPALTSDEAEAAQRARMAGNVNTCHVWDENGEHVEVIRNGGPLETLIPVSVRLAELGRSENEWRDRFLPDR